MLTFFNRSTHNLVLYVFLFKDTLVNTYFFEIIVYNMRAEIKRPNETFFNLIWQLKFFTTLLMPTHNWESATHGL